MLWPRTDQRGSPQINPTDDEPGSNGSQAAVADAPRCLDQRVLGR